MTTTIKTDRPPFGSEADATPHQSAEPEPESESEPTRAVPAIPAPRDLRVSSLQWNGEDRLVLSFPLPEARWPTTLTLAERAVAAMLLDGATSAEIAAQRGTSQRTVTNQVASIFRKTNVASRAELAAHVFAPHGKRSRAPQPL